MKPSQLDEKSSVYLEEGERDSSPLFRLATQKPSLDRTPGNFVRKALLAVFIIVACITLAERLTHAWLRPLDDHASAIEINDRHIWPLLTCKNGIDKERYMLIREALDAETEFPAGYKGTIIVQEYDLDAKVNASTYMVVELRASSTSKKTLARLAPCLSTGGWRLGAEQMSNWDRMRNWYLHEEASVEVTIILHIPPGKPLCDTFQLFADTANIELRDGLVLNTGMLVLQSQGGSITSSPGATLDTQATNVFAGDDVIDGTWMSTGELFFHGAGGDVDIDVVPSHLPEREQIGPDVWSRQDRQHGLFVQTDRGNVGVRMSFLDNHTVYQYPDNILVYTDAGDIDLQALHTDSIVLSSYSGNINATVVPASWWGGQFSTSTSQGDTNIHVRPADGRIPETPRVFMYSEHVASQGNINVRYPRNVTGMSSAKSGNGSVSIDAPGAGPVLEGEEWVWNSLSPFVIDEAELETRRLSIKTEVGNITVKID